MSSAFSVGSRFKLNDGHFMPAVGLGTWEMNGPPAVESIKTAIRLGYRHIDTATIYGNERDVGQAVRESIDAGIVKRSDLFITTKIWRNDQPHAQKALDTSLDNLGLDFVDLYLIHFPMPQRLKTWDAFIRVRDDGLATSIGVSNFMPNHLTQLFKHSDVLPTVNQYEFTPFAYKPDLLALCKSKNIHVCSSSPLTRRAKLEHPTIAAIAKAHGKSPAQVLLRWCLQHNVIPLPKSASAAHQKDNLNLFDFQLTKEQMIVLDGMDESFHVYPDPTRMP